MSNHTVKNKQFLFVVHITVITTATCTMVVY